MVNTLLIIQCLGLWVGAICHDIDHRHGAGHQDVAAGVNVGHWIGLCTTLASLVGHETESGMGVSLTVRIRHELIF